MPNWLKQTLHVVIVAAGIVATLPTMGIALPAWAIAVSTAVGLAAAKAAPGVGQVKS